MSSFGKIGVGLLLVIIGALLLTGVVQFIISAIGVIGIIAGVIISVIGIVGVVKGDNPSSF